MWSQYVDLSFVLAIISTADSRNVACNNGFMYSADRSSCIPNESTCGETTCDSINNGSVSCNNGECTYSQSAPSLLSSCALTIRRSLQSYVPNVQLERPTNVFESLQGSLQLRFGTSSFHFAALGAFVDSYSCAGRKSMSLRLRWKWRDAQLLARTVQPQSVHSFPFHFTSLTSTCRMSWIATTSKSSRWSRFLLLNSHSFVHSLDLFIPMMSMHLVYFAFAFRIIFLKHCSFRCAFLSTLSFSRDCRRCCKSIARDKHTIQEPTTKNLKAQTHTFPNLPPNRPPLSSSSTTTRYWISLQKRLILIRSSDEVRQCLIDRSERNVFHHEG